MSGPRRAAPDRDRRLALVVLGLGVGLVGLAQWLAPLGGPPLYDGVTVVAPYLWLIPPAGSAGGAQGATGTAGVDQGKNRLIAIATPELQPQAQLFATSGTFILPAGTTSIKLSIEPVLPQSLPPDGHIEGNVYRISVTSQDGSPLEAPASAEVTVGLRSPTTDAGQLIEVDAGQGWQKLKTDDAGFAASYLAVVTGGGDYAMVAPGSGGPYPTATPVGGKAGGSSAPSGGPPAGGSAPPASSVGPSSVVIPSIGEIGGSLAPSTAPAAVDTTSAGGPPVAGILVLVVLVIVGGALFLLSRSRRGGPPSGRSTRYQGAHRR